MCNFAANFRKKAVMLTLRVDILKGKFIQTTSWFEGYRHIVFAVNAMPQICSTAFLIRRQDDSRIMI